MSLYELQQSFLSALFNDTNECNEAGQCNDAGQPPEIIGRAGSANHLAVYRNNWRSNLTNALRATYPVVERLVGAEFFSYAANCYIDAHPSRSSNLEEYGEQFAEFLRTFPPAQSLPYLADVATLEAVIETVLVAADDGYTAYSLYSQYPILRIWQVNQAGWEGDTAVDLDAGVDYLLVRRAANDIVIEPIDADRFNALQIAATFQ